MIRMHRIIAVHRYGNFCSYNFRNRNKMIRSINNKSQKSREMEILIKTNNSRIQKVRFLVDFMAEIEIIKWIIHKPFVYFSRKNNYQSNFLFNQIPSIIIASY